MESNPDVSFYPMFIIIIEIKKKIGMKYTCGLKMAVLTVKHFNVLQWFCCNIGLKN